MEKEGVERETGRWRREQRGGRWRRTEWRGRQIDGGGWRRAVRVHKSIRTDAD